MKEKLPIYLLRLGVGGLIVIPTIIGVTRYPDQTARAIACLGALGLTYLVGYVVLAELKGLWG